MKKSKTFNFKGNKYPNFWLLDETVGKICSGIYVKKDYTELRVDFAWGKSLHFKPIEENMSVDSSDK